MVDGDHRVMIFLNQSYFLSLSDPTPRESRANSQTHDPNQHRHHVPLEAEEEEVFVPAAWKDFKFDLDSILAALDGKI